MSQYRERMMNSIKEDLGASDDEWKTLQPKIEKVMTLQRDVRPPMGFAGRFGPPGGGDQAQTDLGKARQELDKAVKDKSASADDVAKKLASYREAREKATSELQAAQKDLKASANPKQEAALVLRGLLD